MSKRIDWKITLKKWFFSEKGTAVVSDLERIKNISILLIYAGNNLPEAKIEFFEQNFDATSIGLIEEIDKNRLLIDAGEQLLEHKQIAETHFNKTKWGVSTFEMPLVYEYKEYVMYFKFQFLNKNDKI